MANFFTSDTHFFHKNIIKYCNRPFVDVDNMNKRMIKNWNAVVTNNDTVWHIGDVSFGKPGETLGILGALNGKINLIPGNHDRVGRCVEKDLAVRCNIFPPYYLFKQNGFKFVLCHFPFSSWERGYINLHGHTHGIHKSKYMQHDVGVDVNNYVPISLEEAVTRATNKPVENHY
jgi:calcineurin-like phosphoesterase family protein